MPIYEYKCDKCGHQLETIQKFSDAPLQECPACGAHALTKLISASAFQLKGTGWYVTDFRDNNKKKDAPKADDKTKTEEKTKTAEKTAGDSGGDKKPADKKPSEV